MLDFQAPTAASPSVSKIKEEEPESGEDEFDWSAPVSGKKEVEDKLELDWSQPVGAKDDDELQLEWSDDPESEEEEKPKKKALPKESLKKTTFEEDEETEGLSGLVGAKAAPSQSGIVDIMAQQLKFIACLKIMMEELSTLATGFEVDGGLLRCGNPF